MTHVPTVILSRTAAALAGLGRRVEIPAKLGPVTILRPLGEGGMSVVHLGKHELLGKNVAVKFLLDIPASAEDPRFTSFLDGARAAAAIRHPGLNTVYNADAVEGVPYLIMDVIEGPNVSELLRAHGAPPLNIARAVIESFCEAVAELHDHAIIHRDIKPANIMIDPTGRVIVTDFGLAMQRPAALFGGAAGVVAGTPPYMAPEMFDGIVSARTDVYAIGATIFELITGRYPFEGGFSEFRLLHRTAQVPVGQLVGVGLPAEVIVVIERAMHKDVLFRPKSARHVLDAFRKACETAGIDRASDAQVQRFVEVGRGGAGGAGAAQAGATEALSYYDRLNTLAEFKRRTPDGTPLPGPPLGGLPGVDSAVTIEPPEPGEAAAVAVDGPRVSVPVMGTKRGVIAPWKVGLAVAPLASLVLSLMYFVGGAMWAGVVLLAEAMGIIEPSATEVILVGSRVIEGRLPGWYSYPAWLLMVGAVFGVPLVASWWVYQWFVFQRPCRAGVTRCGWCGYALKGIADPRCPECGHLIGGPRGGSGVADRVPPPSALVVNRLRRYGAAMLVFLLAFAPLVFVMARIAGSRVPELSVYWVVLRTACLAPAVLVSLVAFHAVGKATAALTGRTYCGHCAAELKNLTSPECPACERHL